MNYGLPYKGSKNKIAAEIVARLPPAEVFVDLFAGGCAVTHAAILSGKYKRFIANDVLKQYPQLFADAIGGKLPQPRTYSREEFKAAKATDAIAATCWSFGNNCRNYLWAKEIEKAKLKACEMILAETREKRRILFRDMMRLYYESFSYFQSLESLQSLQSLQRLQRLQSLQRLNADITVSGKSYSEVQIPEDAVIYADPPYAATDDYGFDFDSGRFHEWLRRIGRPVYVSEYRMPEDFVPVWSKEKICKLGAVSRKKTIERLYLYKDFAGVERKKKAMEQGELDLWAQRNG